MTIWPFMLRRKKSFTPECGLLLVVGFIHSVMATSHLSVNLTRFLLFDRSIGKALRQLSITKIWKRKLTKCLVIPVFIGSLLDQIKIQI